MTSNARTDLADVDDKLVVDVTLSVVVRGCLPLNHKVEPDDGTVT